MELHNTSNFKKVWLRNKTIHNVKFGEGKERKTI